MRPRDGGGELAHGHTASGWERGAEAQVLRTLLAHGEPPTGLTARVAGLGAFPVTWLGPLTRFVLPRPR